ncbi:hypothetical protein J4E93_001103 [Alternaria ventricosa]|uniref:uncharacterized protein n=1 Tax=Alternaria ventricosa TaxID=1187951 RepID=UPI0020C33F2B|nr:uncharacterized protein J4E93_001103 [Alternaria ventricosa]KAI4653340.1 hypothetical protein J4E93_001103 [Alternaria ventricosa]
MDKLLNIIYPPKRPHVLRGVVYTDSAYLQARIDELKEKFFKEWEVIDISDTTTEKTKEGLKNIEGYPEDIDMEKWGLTKKRWATPSHSGLVTKGKKVVTMGGAGKDYTPHLLRLYNKLTTTK